MSYPCGQRSKAKFSQSAKASIGALHFHRGTRTKPEPLTAPTSTDSLWLANQFRLPLAESG